MRNYQDWEFLVGGSFGDLSHYSTHTSTMYLQIYGGVDHWNDCPNDDYRITTIYCQDETDSEVASQIGQELISLFNGASILLSKNYRQMFIERLLYKDIPVNLQPYNPVPALLGKPALSTEEIREQKALAKEIDIRFWLLILATENEDLYFIFKFLTMVPSWVSYYKLMETIESFSTKFSIKLNTVEAEKKRFTNTANNFSLAGFDARHGFKQLTKANKTAGMTLDEAYVFVTKMAKEYIFEKYKNA